ncbi:MAG TPA: FtsX-like permease family protein [Acidimicrobiales bacterium]|nr:FtsX-like permease family protein [Acidimicrobiales bacterium]
MIRTIRLLNLRRIGRQPLRAVLAVVAVAAGSSLIVALMITSRSISGSIRDWGRSVGGPAPLRVVGPLAWAGLDENVLAKVRETPGVGAAVPIVQAVTIAETATGSKTTIVALGVDCSIEALIGKIGCSPASAASSPAAAPPIVSPSLARRLGASGVVRSNLGRIAMTNAPTLPALEDLNQGRVAVFPLSVAQAQFHRPHRLDVIYVQPAPGVRVGALKAELARRIGDWNTVLTRGEPPLGYDYAGVLIPLLTVIGLFALTIGGMLVYNVVALSLAERRRELALGSALGATPRRVLGGLLAEAGVLGAAGGVAGAMLGVGVAYPIVASLDTQIQKLSGVGITVHRGGPIPILGVMIGIAVAVVAAFVPARRATRLDVSSELLGRSHVDDVGTRRHLVRLAVLLAMFITGIVLCRLGGRRGGIEMWQGIAGQVGLLLAVVGGLMAAGTATPFIVRAVPRIAGRTVGVTRLALTMPAREAGRTAAVAMAIGTSIGLAGVLASLIPSIRDGAFEFAQRSVGGGVQVGTLPYNNSASIEAHPSPQALDAVRRVPGAGAVERSMFLLTVGEAMPIAVTAYDAKSLAWMDTLAGRSANESFAHGQVVVGPGLARARHLRQGSKLRLPTPTGWTTLTVGGIVADPNANGVAVVMPATELEARWGPQRGDSFKVVPAPGVSSEELARRINAAKIDPDLRAETPAELAGELADDLAAQLRPFWSLQQALLLVAFIATAATLLLAGIQRRRQHGVLAAVGLAPRSLARLALGEAALVGVTGALLGIVASFGIFEALRHATVVLFGIEGPFRVSVGSDVLYVVFALLTVLAGAALPAWRTSRLEVVDALRYE